VRRRPLSLARTPRARSRWPDPHPRRRRGAARRRLPAAGRAGAHGAVHAGARGVCAQHPRQRRGAAALQPGAPVSPAPRAAGPAGRAPERPRALNIARVARRACCWSLASTRRRRWPRSTWRRPRTPARPCRTGAVRMRWAPAPTGAPARAPVRKSAGVRPYTYPAPNPMHTGARALAGRWWSRRQASPRSAWSTLQTRPPRPAARRSWRAPRRPAATRWLRASWHMRRPPKRASRPAASASRRATRRSAPTPRACAQPVRPGARCRRQRLVPGARPGPHRHCRWSVAARRRARDRHA